MGVKQFAQRMVDKAWSVKTGKPVPVRARPAKSRPAMRAGFAAGEVDNLTASFTGSHLSINEECRRSLVRMQRRSRDLCMNNDYARKFLKMVSANVIGPSGIKLQCQFLNARGEPDLNDQQFVESHWARWGRRQNASVDGRQSWHDIQVLVAQTMARDGEVLIQKVRRKGNYFLKLRVLECDHLDINHNHKLPSGNRIVMGVELNRSDTPVAYWLTNKHPGDYANTTIVKRKRVPARDIIHLFIADRPGQVRGVPWMHSAIRRLNMMGGYEEAELVAARVGASKMGFYTSPDGDSFGADDAAGAGQEYDDYDLVQEAAPGTFEQLPEGVGFQTFDPQHPTSAFADFTKAVLRGAASGLNVAYNTLSNDLEGVNFSSIRSGVLEEREQWKMIQNWLSSALHDEIYREWLSLEVDMAGGALTALPASKIDTKFSDISWQGRGWSWVDPLKDVKSSAEEYALGTTTLTDIAATRGKDLNDIFKQRAAEIALAETYGITVGQLVAPAPQMGDINNDNT